MVKRYFLSLLFLVPFLSAFSQSTTGLVRGQVKDANGEAIAFANALLYSTADSAMVKAGFSDQDGNYILAPVTAGRYWLKISFVGYADIVTEPFDFADGQQLERAPLTMEETGTTIDEVQITTDKPLLTVKPDMTVFNVDGTANAIGENAFNLLRKAPGVVVDNNDNIMLLGKSGVRIYVDGKPSPLSATDLANLLKGMQSDQIESFEIITNPSAKYDAEGNAGIINIKLKRDKTLGANASLNLGYAIGIFSKYNGSLSANYRNKKMNIFASYGVGDGVRRNFMEFFTAQRGFEFDKSTEIFSDYRNHNFRGGLDYLVNDKHTVGFLVSGFFNPMEQRTASETVISDMNADTVSSILDAKSINDARNDNLNLNVNYKFDNKKGVTTNIDADAGFFRNELEMFQPNLYLDPETGAVMTDRTFTSNSPTDIDIYTFKIDHERPAFKGKLGMGIKSSYVTTDNIYDYYDVVNGLEVLDTSRSNAFDYNENINAAYLSYQRQIKKWGLQAGLRAEQTNSVGQLTALQSTDNDTVKRNYLNFFPSAGLTFSPSRTNVFQLNYSRRIDRPRYQDLNPFQFKLDELSFREGNPFLQPQYTHNLQLSHTYKYTLNTSVSYAYTTDYFTMVTDTAEGFVSFIRQENLATRKVATFNVSYPKSLTKWWSTFTNFSLYHLTQSANFDDGRVIDFGVTAYSAYHQSNFSLPKDFSIQLSGFYNSPSVWGANFKTRRFWGVEAGVQKKLWQSRGNLKLSVSDIFNTMQWGGSQDFSGLVMTGRGGWESRQFKVNFTYLFGNSQVKSARKRKTGLDEEKDRAGGGGAGSGPGQ